jgi:hypothetical protein
MPRDRASNQRKQKLVGSLTCQLNVGIGESQRIIFMYGVPAWLMSNTERISLLKSEFLATDSEVWVRLPLLLQAVL